MLSVSLLQAAAKSLSTVPERRGANGAHSADKKIEMLQTAIMPSIGAVRGRLFSYSLQPVAYTAHNPQLSIVKGDLHQHCTSAIRAALFSQFVMKCNKKKLFHFNPNCNRQGDAFRKNCIETAAVGFRTCSAGAILAAVVPVGTYSLFGSELACSGLCGGPI